MARARCPNCRRIIEHLDYSCWEHSRAYGSYTPGGGHEHRENSDSDSDNFEYSCPECDHVIIDDPDGFFESNPVIEGDEDSLQTPAYVQSPSAWHTPIGE